MGIMKNRWVILAVSILVCLVLGILYAFSIFTIPLEADFGWNRQQTSMTFSLILIFMSIGMITGGNVIAVTGPRKAATIGGFLIALGFFIASYTSNLAMLYVSYGVIAGYGIGLTNIVPMAVLMRWFPDKKGLVSGLITMALAFGTFFLGTKLSGAWVADYGWAQTFKILSGIFLVVAVGGAQFFNLPDPGYKPPNWTPPEGQTNEIWGYSRVHMMKTGACWMVFFWMLGIHFGGLMIISQVVPLAVEKGVAKESAAMAMATYAIANGIGRLFFASLCDKVGRNRP